MPQKRLVTIQDISCIGKCSLTAVIPIISAFGIEAVPLPTAVLSTHTGAGFKDFTFRDLTSDMPGIINHWKSMNIEFDAMYSGYLGSIDQLEIVDKFFREFKNDSNIIFVDPVMGDEGVLYTGFDKEFANKMRCLCSHADVICPNITEAAYLTGMDYSSCHDTENVQMLANALKSTGAKNI